MKKIIIIAFVVLVILVSAYFLFLRKSPGSSSDMPVLNATSSQAVVHVPVNLLDGARRVADLSTFVNTSTKASVALKEVLSGGTRVPDANIYLNGEKISGGDFVTVNGQQVRKTVEITGDSLYLPTFSPDGKFFSFMTRVQIGCCELQSILYVLDTQNKAIFQINPPQRAADYQGSKETPTQSIFPVVDALNWASDDALSVSSYFAGYFSDNQYYRVSPESLWRLDVTTREYSPRGAIQ